MKTTNRLKIKSECPETKLLSLLFLRRALMEERYEECASHLERALKLGAAREEITRMLKMPGTHPEECN